MTDSSDTVGKYARFVNTAAVKAIEPIVVASGRGALLRDAGGREYVDCYSGIAVVNTGHVHPKVAEAAKAQIDRLIHGATYVYHVPAVADLAETLAEITPGDLQKTFFCNSGAEAIEGSLRLAKIHNGRSEFIALQKAFHGRTYATLSLTGNAARKSRGGPYMPGVAFAPAPDCYRCPMNLEPATCGLACADAVEDVIRFSTSGDVSAFVVEPVLGEGGLIPLPDGYLRRVKEILDQYAILLIDDEVQTGFGRTGRMFGIEHDGVEPDILAMAKGIAAGFPLGGFIARARMADEFRPGEHLSTFGGNPVACAAASANIRVIQEEGLLDRAARLGEMATAELRRMQDRHPLIGDVRGRGLMIGAELVADRDTKEPASAQAGALKRACLEAGVLIGVGGPDANVVRIQPPLVITEEQLMRALSVVDEALSELAG